MRFSAKEKELLEDNNNILVIFSMRKEFVYQTYTNYLDTITRHYKHTIE